MSWRTQPRQAVPSLALAQRVCLAATGAGLGAGWVAVRGGLG